MRQWPIMYFVTQVENVHNWKINFTIGCLWGSLQAFKMIFTLAPPMTKRSTKIYVPHLDLVACSRHFCHQILIYLDKWKCPILGAATLGLKSLVHDEGSRRCLWLHSRFHPLQNTNSFLHSLHARYPNCTLGKSTTFQGTIGERSTIPGWQYEGNGISGPSHARGPFYTIPCII